MTIRCTIKVFTRIISAFVICFAFASSANAGWYWIKVKNVAPSSVSGDTFVQFSPGVKPDGSNETQFTGTARGIISQSDLGGNKVLAVLLTAITADANVLIQMTNTPAWTPAQMILNAGIQAP